MGGLTSPEGADLVRRAYDAWNWYGVDHLAPFLADGVIVEDAPELPDAGTWSGSEAVLRRLDEVGEAAGGGWVELHGIEEHDGAYLVTMTWKLDNAEGESSLGDVFHLVDVEAGKIARIRVYLTRP